VSQKKEFLPYIAYVRCYITVRQKELTHKIGTESRVIVTKPDQVVLESLKLVRRRNLEKFGDVH
jgi:hypothetical protein